ncbi:MAG: 4-hydroxythreonine-4-phosphate dehydrogenase PdxA [Planctomycetes bacterium]|nr:4-hydroxythreonine-4-phosphate dehydrogenase PdxA [Planctomycetota bacterium]
MNPRDPSKETPPRSEPVIAITMGDPMGIGPEVVAKALCDPAILRLARFVVYGQNQPLVDAADRAGLRPFWFRIAKENIPATRGMAAEPVVVDYGHEDSLEQAHAPSRAGGLLSKAFVEDAIADALRPVGDARRVDAVVTGPISKESWSNAGFKWPGHTELFAARCKAARHAMLFESPRLRVVLATAHVPLMDIRNLLTIGRVFDPIDLGYNYCRQLGIEKPAIAVCGLNPHAGENGLFGDEEERVIAPAIEIARRNGIDARGPFPGDTIFIDAAAGKWDLVVAMYHDQGLIPVKLLGFDRAVNTTIGLPIVRTSPDHGTAFNIAGKNTASPNSFKAAIELAVRLARSAEPGASSVQNRETPPKDAALDAIGFEDTDAE